MVLIFYQINISPNINLASLADSIKPYISTLSLSKHPFAILDILIVSVLFYFIYTLIKDTKAVQIVWGIIILGGIFILGKILKLDTLNWLLKYFLAVLVVAIPIIFQPELRKALEKLGRAKIVTSTKKFTKRQLDQMIDELAEACKTLSKNKTGALIVIQRETGLTEYLESGTELNAKLSSDLLLTIFFPNSPLHDGAVILKGNTIASAGCILPLSEEEYSYKYGTRHKAALGLSEVSDAIIIVVSQETGSISVAANGKISGILTIKQLKDILIKLLE